MQRIDSPELVGAEDRKPRAVPPAGRAVALEHVGELGLRGEAAAVNETGPSPSSAGCCASCSRRPVRPGRTARTNSSERGRSSGPASGLPSRVGVAYVAVATTSSAGSTMVTAPTRARSAPTNAGFGRRQALRGPAAPHAGGKASASARSRARPRRRAERDGRPRRRGRDGEAHAVPRVRSPLPAAATAGRLTLRSGPLRLLLLRAAHRSHERLGRPRSGGPPPARASEIRCTVSVSRTRRRGWSAVPAGSERRAS